jgi:hypothetical protein
MLRLLTLQQPEKAQVVLEVPERNFKYRRGNERRHSRAK